MGNEGLDEARSTDDVPNIDSCMGSASHELAARGKTTAAEIFTRGIKGGHNFSGNCVTDCGGALVAQNKAFAVRGEGNVMTGNCGSSLATIDVPLLDDTTR
jgi:hypothetical protein